MKERRPQKGARFNILIGGGGDWYRAHCPELNVYGGGASIDEATDRLLESVQATSEYVVGLNGQGANDPRRPYAEKVVSGLPNIKALFDL